MVKTTTGKDGQTATDKRPARAQPKTQDGLESRQLLFLSLLTFRIVNALLLNTFFQPDEFFQVLEPAWQIAFGKESGAWMTWEWHHALRSSIHPVLFSIPYILASKLSELLHFSPASTSALLLATPKVLQAFFAATGEYYTFRLAEATYGHQSPEAWTTILLLIISPWQWFCSTRTFSNCLETTLTAIALSKWPWNPTSMLSSSGNTVAFLCAALACILRPTNLVVWAILSLVFIARCPSLSIFRKWLSRLVFSGFVVLAVSTLCDFLYYSELVFPFAKFLYFNVVKSLAVFYGSNRHDYYITEGIPLLTITYLPWCLVRLFSVWKRKGESQDSSLQIQRQLALVIIGLSAVLSLVAHKEVRFIYPLLPMLVVLIAPSAKTVLEPLTQQMRGTTGARSRPSLALIAIVVTNLVVGIFASTHQIGVINVMHYLRSEYEQSFLNKSSSGSESTMTVGFLMPCHSTPWRSHLIYPGIKAWALTCEPPVNLPISQRDSYYDEADRFYHSPAAFIREEMPFPPPIFAAEINAVAETPNKFDCWNEGDEQRVWPQYLVFFDNDRAKPAIEQGLVGSPYRECKRFWNSWVHDDIRRKGDVVVWCVDP